METKNKTYLLDEFPKVEESETVAEYFAKIGIIFEDDKKED